MDVIQFVFFSHTVRAKYAEFDILLRLLSQVANAKSADVVVTAGRHKDGVEVSKTDGTVVLEYFTFHSIV